MEKEFTMIPQNVALVHTKNRTIKTKIPVPEAVEVLSEMQVRASFHEWPAARYLG